MKGLFIRSFSLQKTELKLTGSLGTRTEPVSESLHQRGGTIGHVCTSFHIIGLRAVPGDIDTLELLVFL